MSRAKHEHVRFFCDGSNVGMSIGAGVVEVDQFGFMECFHYEKMHPCATSVMGEEFALACTLKRILSKETKVFAVIYLDHDGLRSQLAAEELQDSWSDHLKYVYTLLQQARQKNAVELERNPEEPSCYPYINTAHALSRFHINGRHKFFLEGRDLIAREPSSRGNKSSINQLCKQDAPKLQDVGSALAEVAIAKEEETVTTGKNSPPVATKVTPPEEKVKVSHLTLKTKREKDVHKIQFTKGSKKWMAKVQKGRAKAIEGRKPLDVYMQAVKSVLRKKPNAYVEVIVQPGQVSSHKQIYNWVKSEQKNLNARLQVRHLLVDRNALDDIEELLDLMGQGRITTHLA